MPKSETKPEGAEAGPEREGEPIGDAETPETTEGADPGADGEATGEAEAGEDAGEGEQEAEAGPEGEPKLPENVQRAVDARIGREVEKTRKEREAREAAEAELTSLRERATENLPVHPSYVSKDEADAIRQANELEAREADLIEKFDGFTDANGKEVTGAEVRRQWAETRRSLQKVQAAANDAYARAKRQMLADMEAGRRMRVERTKAEERAASAARSRVQAPRPAAAPRPGGGTPAVAAAKRRGPSLERLQKAGGTREARLRELWEYVS